MKRVYTAGHSSRELDELLALLAEPGIELLADVRRFPGSRRHPHFSREVLAPALADAGIAYEHYPDLGGKRRGSATSRNTAWREAGFRAYADHMASPEFQLALSHLEQQATERPTALLCAEAEPWRCHRRLLADALTVRGWEVAHRIAAGHEEIHRLHPDAQPGDDGVLTYPDAQERQGRLF